MRPSVNPAPSRVNRRALLTTGAVGATAVAASVAMAPKADAAPGQAVLAGRANSAGAFATTLVSTSTTPTLQVRNNGTGAAAFFFAQSSNGFAGGTAAGSKYGLSAANTGAAGGGAGLAASGVNNYGILANTANPERAAILARHTAAAGGISGAAVVGVGGANIGVIGSTDDPLVPAVLSFGDTMVVDGYLSVFRNDVGYQQFALLTDLPRVTFTGTAVLNDTGAGLVPLPEADATTDLTQAAVIVTPNSGGMPGLFATVVADELSIAGGVAAGTVSWQVTALRNDFLTAAQPKGARGAGKRAVRIDRVGRLTKPSAG